MKISEIRKRLDSREIGAVELTREYLDRIDRYDGKINSYITVCRDEAVAMAERAQKLIDSGNASALTGIPLSVKDNICTNGIKTTCASRMLKDFVPVYDAYAVEKLKNEGFVMLGKTNMDEFAMGGSSQTSYFGGVKNPYNTECVPGGSSGGAAASVAAGMCAAALGSDTGGSVRQPSAFCGVTGLKPTYGAVSRWGLIAFASSFDQIGVCALSAEDAGYVFDAICGRDENDATSSARAKGGSTELIGKDISNITVGIPREFIEGASDEVKETVQKAAEFYRQTGCNVKECSLPSLEYAVSAYYLISSAEAASNLSRFDGIKYGHRSGLGEDYNALIKSSRSEGFGTEVKRRIMLGNYALCSGYYDAYYNKARRIRAQIRNEYRAIFDSCDVILTPTAPTPAYRIGAQEDDPVKMYLADVCTVTANIAGLPSVSTVCGYSGGLPVGMSITGRPFDEKTILAVCDRFETDFERKECCL